MVFNTRAYLALVPFLVVYFIYMLFLIPVSHSLHSDRRSLTFDLIIIYLFLFFWTISMVFLMVSRFIFDFRCVCEFVCEPCSVGFTPTYRFANSLEVNICSYADSLLCTEKPTITPPPPTTTSQIRNEQNLFI